MRGVTVCKRLMEGVTLLLVILSPWAFGAIEPFFEFLLLLGVGVLLVLWSARILLEGRVAWQKCPVTLCLAALFGLGVIQLMPLPSAVLDLASPQSAYWYDQLLPRETEVLPSGQPHEPVAGRGQTVSLYPGATRVALMHLLAVVCVFSVVRNNTTSPETLRRLCLAATCNGALLALFALVQHFSSPPDVVYWTFPAPGGVFGPFICRNHFPFYLNICLGLALGLLLATRQRDAPGQADRQAGSPSAILQQPAVLWLMAGLVLMTSSILVSRSRGGLMALLGAGALVAGVKVWRSGRLLRPASVLVVGALSLGLVAWLGYDLVDARLARLWHGEVLKETRAPLWSMLTPLLREFPVFGTGWGTFEYVEPLHRTSAADASVIYEHAHNEYLETWIEGGIVGLVLGLLAVGLVLWLGVRAYDRYRTQPAGGLILGALLGFLTVVIHSFVDFGLHIPAISLLAAVVAAFLCSLGSRPPGMDGEAPAYVLRLGCVAPVAVALTLILLAIFLGVEGWRANRVQRLRLAAYQFLASDRPDRLSQALARFALAAQLAPDYARLQTEAGQAYLDDAEEQTRDLELTAQLGAAAGLFRPSVPAGLPSGPAETLASGMTTQTLGTLAWEPILQGQEDRLAATHVSPGLRHFLRARDLCPVFGAPHVRLAANRSYLLKGDPATTYLARARQLVPADPELWYLSGLEEVLHGDKERASQDWRHSLELSPLFFEEILARSAVLLGPQKAAAEVVPDDPELLLRAACQLYPRPESAADRRPILQRALSLLTGRASKLTSQELHTLALLHHRLGQDNEAIRALKDALLLAPHQAEWRLSLAGLLFRQGRWQEARDEARLVLLQQPGQAAAQKLLDEATGNLLRAEDPR